MLFVDCGDHQPGGSAKLHPHLLACPCLPRGQAYGLTTSLCREIEPSEGSADSLFATRHGGTSLDGPTLNWIDPPVLTVQTGSRNWLLTPLFIEEKGLGPNKFSGIK